MTAHTLLATQEATAADRKAAIMLEVRARLVEEVLAGNLDAERARAIFAGLAAHADEVARWTPP